MTASWRRVPRSTRATAAAVLVAATLSVAVGTSLGTSAGAADVTRKGSAPPQPVSARHGAISLGSGASITLGADAARKSAPPADPNADPYAYRSCRDLSTPTPASGSAVSDYPDPDLPSGSVQQPPGYVQGTVIPSGNGAAIDAMGAYGGGYSNARKLGAAALVPPGLTLADVADTYYNPPLNPPPYSDPNDPNLTAPLWHSADKSVDSPGGIWSANFTPTTDKKVFYCVLLLGQLDDAPAAPYPPAIGQAEYPPVKATFLAFGFMPVTATVHIQEQVSGGKLVPVTLVSYQQYKHFLGPAPGIRTISHTQPPGCFHIAGISWSCPPPAAQYGSCTHSAANEWSCPEAGFNYCQILPDGSNPCSPLVIVVTAAVTLRLSDVTVNGTPLDVGSHCQTTGPLYSPGNPLEDPGNNVVVLQGGSDPTEPYPQFTLVGTGGIQGAIYVNGSVAGTATIPPFTGCVTPSGDNLNPLLNATVSGPGNYIKMDTGGACTDITFGNCINGVGPMSGGRPLLPFTTVCPIPGSGPPGVGCFPLTKLYR